MTTSGVFQNKVYGIIFCLYPNNYCVTSAYCPTLISSEMELGHGISTASLGALFGREFLLYFASGNGQKCKVIYMIWLVYTVKMNKHFCLYMQQW